MNGLRRANPPRPPFFKGGSKARCFWVGGSKAWCFCEGGSKAWCFCDGWSKSLDDSTKTGKDRRPDSIPPFEKGGPGGICSGAGLREQRHAP